MQRWFDEFSSSFEKSQRFDNSNFQITQKLLEFFLTLRTFLDNLRIHDRYPHSSEPFGLEKVLRKNLVGGKKEFPVAITFFVLQKKLIKLQKIREKE